MRIKLLFFLFCLWLFLIIARLFYWQIIDADALAAIGKQQYFQNIETQAQRGKLFFSDGSYLVANQPAYLLFAQPKLIADVDLYTKKLAPLLGLNEATVAAKLSLKDSYWVPLTSKLEEAKAEKIKELNLEGIGFERQSKRYYPEGSMSAHLIGFVGFNADGSDKGYFGLEGFYDREIKGRSGFINQEKDALGYPILLGQRQEVKPRDGHDLVLYLDRTAQFVSEKKLLKGISDYQAKAGLVLVMDPYTGGILASASYPSYNQGDYYNYPSEFYKNPVVAQTYEPGSTFKIIIMSAALNEGVVSPSTLYNEEGPVEVGGFKIRTWNNDYHGEITMTQVLQLSSNVGMAFVTQKLGLEKTLYYLKLFGFNELTGIDLQEETTSYLRPDKDWKEVDLATVSFGQGIAVSPIQMVRAVSAIANGGNLIQPHVVYDVINEKGERTEIKPKIIRNVISNATGALISEMMVASVEHGEAKWKVPKGYRIAGKTGTAQIPVEGHYDTDKTIASFIGFAPVVNPKFVMLVALREPEASPWGSETAAPLWFDIASELLNLYQVQPEY